MLLPYYFVANGKPVFKNGSSSRENLPDLMILDIFVFHNFPLIAELSAKPYKYWKLFSQLVIIHLEC